LMIQSTGEHAASSPNRKLTLPARRIRRSVPWTLTDPQ
jgi:hypothetical protein